MKRYSILIILSILSFSLFLQGCREDYTEVREYEEIQGIRISANLANTVSTRQGITSGPITSGKYNIIFPIGYSTINSTYGYFRHLYFYGEVEFIKMGNEILAIPYVTYNGTYELSWAANQASSSGTYNRDGIRTFYTETGATLFMDDYPVKTTGQTDSIVTIPNNYKYIYTAGIFDEEKNDPLWGTAFLPKNSLTANFDMHHLMSRLKIVVKVDESEENSLGINLDNAIVKITDIILAPNRYNRVHGEFELPTDAASFKELLLVNPDSQNKVEWKPKETENGITTYITQDFVVPPQTLKTGEGRPRLVIQIPRDDFNKGSGIPIDQKYVEFSNVLPRALMELDSEGEQTGVSLFLNFLREHCLTINTTLRPGNLALEFTPATVEQWVDKGTNIRNTKQASISNASDFSKLIQYYNNNNEFGLSRYGFQTDNGKWEFQFWNPYISLKLEEIRGSMVPGDNKPDYSFNFGNRTELLQISEESTVELVGSEGENKLYEITSGISDGSDLLETD